MTRLEINEDHSGSRVEVRQAGVKLRVGVGQWEPRRDVLIVYVRNSGDGESWAAGKEI